MIPLLVAFLCGAADFAAEMLVLRSGRFGLGASAQSTTLLLALALAGLGIGAALARRLRGVRSFIILRIAAGSIGSAAVAAPLWLAGRGGILASVGAPAASLAAAFIFAIPSGAAIPLLYPWTKGRAMRAGLLVSAGALGSVAGAWFGGVAGPIAVGVYISGFIIFGTNLVAAALALLSPSAFQNHPDTNANIKETPSEEWRQAHDAKRASPGAGLWLAFSAGAATLAFESLLGRFTPFFLGDCSDSLAFLLASALLAIAVGSAAGGFLLKFMKPRSLGAVLLGALALAGPVLLCILEFLARDRRLANPRSLEDYIYARVLFLGLLTAPPLLIAGALSPVAFALARGESRERASKLNFAYAAGALAPALFIPVLLSLGFSTTALCGAVGILAFPAAATLVGLRSLPLLLPIVSGALLGASPITTRVPPFRTIPWLEVYEAKEGPVGLVAAVLDRKRHEKTLFTNAFRAAATGDDYRYTRSLTHLPMLLSPAEPSTAAIIAVGTGSTAAAATRYKSMKRIDLVEISSEVFDLLHWFSPASRALFVKSTAATRQSPGSNPTADFDPRIKIVMEDGRRFAARDGDAYDLMILEPLLPDTPAAYPFYTKEFYQLAKRRLTDGGVLTQWIPILATEPRAFRSLVSTFTACFEHRALFLVGKSAILLGSNRPLRWNDARAQAALGDALLSADLRRTGCASAGDVAAQCVLGTEGLAAFTTDVILSDERAWMERAGFLPGIERIRYEVENLDTLIRAREAVPSELLPSMEFLSAGEQEARRNAGLAYLKARRVLAEVGSAGRPGAESDAAALVASTAHPFSGMEGEAFVARRMLNSGLTHLAENEVSRALPDLQQAARGTRDPLAILAYAVALLRSSASDEAAAEAALALSLDSTAAITLPDNYPNEARDRWAQDVQILSPLASEIVTKAAGDSPDLESTARMLKSKDPAVRVRARRALVRDRDLYGFQIEELAGSALTLRPELVAAALEAGRELYDPTLGNALRRLEAAKK